MTECKYPSCDQEVGQDPQSRNYRHRSFCSVKHDVKYDHLKSDARDAERSERQSDERTAK